MTDTVDDIETAPGLLDIFAKVNLSISTLAQQIAKQNRIEQAKLDREPNYITLSKTSQPTGTTDIIDFGGPQTGRVWDIRILNAVAVPLAANASIVTWYVGQNMSGPAAGMLPPTMARWQFLSVPGFEDFSSAIQVKAGEHLLAGLHNVPASSTIALTAIVHDLLDGSRRDE